MVWPPVNIAAPLCRGQLPPVHSRSMLSYLLVVIPVFVPMVTELASLTPAQLMEKIRALQNMAYQLGVEEGKRGCRRGGRGRGRGRGGRGGRGEGM